MPRARRTISMPLSLLATLALTVAPSAGPASPGAHGPLLERLRSSLDEAERAVAQGRLRQAATRFLVVQREAEELDRANLPLARAVDGLADVRRLEGRLEEAVELYLRSAELWESLLGPDQPRLATTLHNLGATQLARERSDLALPPLRRALEIWEAAFGPDSAQAAPTRALYLRVRREREGSPQSISGRAARPAR